MAARVISHRHLSGPGQGLAEARIWATATNTNSRAEPPKRLLSGLGAANDWASTNANHSRAESPKYLSNCRALRESPMNIPDSPKPRAGAERKVQEDDKVEGNVRLAPHIYLAMTRPPPLSVEEGTGRKLIGLDLSMSRNVVLKATGYED